MTRINPKTGKIVASIPLKVTDLSEESSVAAGEGAVWVLSSQSEGKLLKIDPKTNRSSNDRRAAKGGRDPSGVWRPMGHRVERRDTGPPRPEGWFRRRGDPGREGAALPGGTCRRRCSRPRTAPSTRTAASRRPASPARSGTTCAAARPRAARRSPSSTRRTPTSPRSARYTRKFKEFFIAVKLDRRDDKDKILQDYLNTIYFGRGAYGIQTASQPTSAWAGVTVVPT